MPASAGMTAREAGGKKRGEPADRLPATGCCGAFPQAFTPSFFCRLDEEVVYWKSSFFSG